MAKNVFGELTLTFDHQTHECLWPWLSPAWRQKKKVFQGLLKSCPAVFQIGWGQAAGLFIIHTQA